MENKKQKPTNTQTYSQVKVLGVGSFGKAILVESTTDRTPYVIKVIDIANMTDDEKKEAYLEAKILERLDHSNIIKFVEVFITRKNRYTLNIVMDYADGGDLQSKIKEQKGKHFSENLILDWFTQICLAIKHIHDKKVLHRDLKSQNVFLTKNGMIKLGDFGIAKCLNYTLQKVTTIVGTPYYLSPEIVQNKPYSFKSDIWSLGIILYEMCALKMPFDASSLPLLSLKIIRGAYNPIPSTYSKDLKNLVNMMLNVDPSKRPNINEILKTPIIQTRIKNFLNEMEYNCEFSHTILHDFNIFNKNHYNNLYNNKRTSNSSNNGGHSAETPSRHDNNQNLVKRDSSGNNLNPTRHDSNEQFNINPKQFLDLKKNKQEVKPFENVKASPISIHPKNELTPPRNFIEDKKEKKNQINEFLIKKNDQKKKAGVIQCKPIELTKETSSENVKNVNNEKERKVELRNFMEDMRKKNKETVTNEGVIWMKGMEEALDKEYVNNQYAKQDSGNVEDVIGNKLKNLKVDDKEETKKYKEYFNAHKMLIELDNIQNNANSNSDSNVITTTNNTNNQTEEESINSTNIASSNSVDDVTEDKVLADSETHSETGGDETTNEDDSDYSQIEELRIELEQRLGLDLLTRIYKIIDSNTPYDLLNYDYDKIRELLIKDLSNSYSMKVVEMCVEVIPEVYAIIIKERAKTFRK